MRDGLPAYGLIRAAATWAADLVTGSRFTITHLHGWDQQQRGWTKLVCLI
jgi:hypothetical protein